MNKNFFKNKTIFVTGGTGSFGQIFIWEVLKNLQPKKIIIYSRDELKQYEMQKNDKFNDYIKKSKLRFFIGDIRDKSRLFMAMDDDIDVVIHSAALKQVPTTEYNPFEAVKTNIIGTQNLIESSLKNNVKRFIGLSTDKAAAPVNLYGATKLTADKLIISANNYKGKKDIKFSIVRYGNVLKSRGSVVPLFLEQKKNGLITITDKEMTRFNITLQEGVNFVIDCVKLMWGGEIFVPKLPSYKILDLVKAIDPKIKTKIIGIRGGEKIHEEMITSSDSINTYEFKNYYVILPSKEYLKWNLNNFLKSSSYNRGKKCIRDFSYNSKNNSIFLNSSDLRKLIYSNK